MFNTQWLALALGMSFIIQEIEQHSQSTATSDGVKVIVLDGCIECLLSTLMTMVWMHA